MTKVEWHEYKSPVAISEARRQAWLEELLAMCQRDMCYVQSGDTFLFVHRSNDGIFVLEATPRREAWVYDDDTDDNMPSDVDDERARLQEFFFGRRP